MNTGSARSVDSAGWRELYTAALFEIDRTGLPDRIAHAEEAVALRVGELLHVAGDHIEEGTALEDAKYALHALRSNTEAA
jgi:hypothetical protein